MAIAFSKSLPQLKMLMAFNNNTIRFQSNTVGTIDKATIDGLGMTNVVLYPHPDGSFYFNFKEYITANLNTKNFAGEFGEDFSAPGSTFNSPAVDGYYIEGNVTIKVKFKEPQILDDEAILSIAFGLGVENLTDRASFQFVNSKQRNWLTPQNSNGDHYVKFWKGYPFKVAYLLGYNYAIGVDETVQVMNTEQIPYATMDLYYENTERVNHIHFSDGVNNLFNTSQKIIKFERLIVEQVDGACGVYMKFRNRYGKWNYWLFEGNHYNNRSSKAIGELYNDFKDVFETVSPIIQLGRTADSTIKVQGDRLTENEKLIVEELIDSPKIYYFIGEPNTIPAETDWIEVSLKTNSFVTKTPKKKVYKYTIEFDLPNRYTQTL